MTESRRRRLGHHSDPGRGMTLPFQPLNLAFSHMYYSVDMPPVMATFDHGTSLCTAHLVQVHACLHHVASTCEETHS